ncbi:MAG: T9SS type A sorting domain-containing protein [Flavobacteriales bacterium]|nr:T9SS type A sorting domain-containing protein [Flavobacteriales bacterium]
MRWFGLFVIFFVSQLSYAHRGDYLAITDVQVTETEDTYIYSFLIENIKDLSYTDVRIDFWINMKSVFFKRYPLITADQKFIPERFIVPKKMLDIDNDLVNIEITQIFGKKKDWGGWDSDRSNGRQVNTLYSEFYVDAPWRMKKTDANGNLNSIPVTFYLHDADLVVGTTVQIDMIDIRLKNASSNSFSAPLTFNNIPLSQFKGYFSCMSQTDNAFSIQGFDLTSFVASSGTTIDFNQTSDFWNDYEEVDATYWFFNFNIPADKLVGYEDVIDIQVTIQYGNLTFSDDVVGMRVFRSDEDIPTLTDFYRGDTHLHSIFTQNDAETGLPMKATKEAGKLIGLDWITSTDHTSDYDNYGTTVSANWARIQSDVQQFNQEDPSLIYIAAQEVALNNHEDKLVHMLAYPSYSHPYDFSFIGDGDGDLVSTSVSINSALNNIVNNDGFAYAAHPFATEDALPTIPVNGSIWNIGHSGFPSNGSNFPVTGGNIICNDLSAPSDVFSSETGKLIKDGLAGAQIWNVRNTLEMTGDELDPWDIDNGGDGFTEIDTNSYGHHLNRFRQGQEIVNFINQLGLQMINNDPSYQNWKLYYSGGADAHGSFNSSNTDDFGGFGTINDNAVGKVNTVVYCPNGMGVDGGGVLKSLQNGNSTISDGPIMAIGISSDGNNASNEILMGEDAVVDIDFTTDYYVNFDFATTQEFGDIKWFKFIVGTEDGEQEIYIGDAWTRQGSQHYSVSLDNLISQALGLADFPQKKYMYIRVEMQTYVDLSANSSIHRIGYQYHHSFSNPIWIKYDEIKPEVSELTLTTRPNPFHDVFYLDIKTIEAEDVSVSFYDPQGKLVYFKEVFVNLSKTLEFTSDQLQISEGTYVIRVATDEEQKEIKVIKY